MRGSRVRPLGQQRAGRSRTGPGRIGWAGTGRGGAGRGGTGRVRDLYRPGRQPASLLPAAPWLTCSLARVQVRELAGSDDSAARCRVRRPPCQGPADGHLLPSWRRRKVVTAAAKAPGSSQKNRWP